MLAPLVMLALSVAAHAQILIGQTVGVTGAVAATVKEADLGAQMYIDAVNAKGGVGGQKIELITLDDKFDPKLTFSNATTLIEERQVLALFMTRGTPHTEGILPLVTQHGVPLIGPSTGAMVFHKPVNKWVFNVRAPYQREAEKAIAHMVSIGTRRIGLIHVDDSFGADGAEGALKGLTAAKLKAVAVAKFDRTKPDFSAIAPAMAEAQAQAIMIIGSGTAVVDAVKAIKATGSTAQLITLSNNASSGFTKLLGEQGRGVIVSQTLPRSFGYAFVREATQLARERDIADVSPAMLEGFVSAKVLVEALRKTTGKLTRDRLQSSLEGMQKFDLGGLEVSFSPTDHTGITFSDLSIISEDGKFRR